jgi:hypothetical protein
MILRDDRYHSLLVIAIRLRKSTIRCLLLYFSNIPALPLPMVAPVPAKITTPRLHPPAATRRRPLLTTHHSLPTLFLPPSSASRAVNISPVLSSFRILPRRHGGVQFMIPDVRLSDLSACQVFCLHRVAASLSSLGTLFCIRFLCFQSFGASFHKTPGVGGTPTLLRQASLPHHMRHVASLSHVPSFDCAYFPSPRGCTLCDLCVPHSVPSVLRFFPPFYNRPLESSSQWGVFDEPTL